ncbi:hypothetical protein DPMN_010158 [Dreissena polymorpha]|uniref:Uncharacterized protein n=1 Tax=Dreissena polymorpha TaxID=45954 RepID=A0A9D4S198_DREPO|nr:hypothetical protein DPMN_010158 [Dreissena polymorpha]
MVRQKNFISQGNATVFGEENMATSGENLKILKMTANYVGVTLLGGRSIAFKRLRSGAQDRRKVNRIAGDSNAHRIKDVLPDDIAVKCLPISDENM